MIIKEFVNPALTLVLAGNQDCFECSYLKRYVSHYFLLYVTAYYHGTQTVVHVVIHWIHTAENSEYISL